MMENLRTSSSTLCVCCAWQPVLSAPEGEMLLVLSAAVSWPEARKIVRSSGLLNEESIQEAVNDLPLY